MQEMSSKKKDIDVILEKNSSGSHENYEVAGQEKKDLAAVEERKDRDGTIDEYEKKVKEFEAGLEKEGHRYVVSNHKIADDFSEIERVLGKNLKSKREDIPDIQYSRRQFKRALDSFIAHQIENLNRADLTPEEIDLAVGNLTKYVKICEGVKLFDLKTTVGLGIFRDPESMAGKIDKFIDWHRRKIEEEKIPSDTAAEEKPSNDRFQKEKYMESIKTRSDIGVNFKDPVKALYIMGITERCNDLNGERKNLEKEENPNDHDKKRLTELDETIGDIKNELLKNKRPFDKVNEAVSKIYGKYGEEFDNLEVVSRLSLLDITERGIKIGTEPAEPSDAEEIIKKLEAQLSGSDGRIKKGMTLEKMHDMIFIDIFRKMAHDLFHDSKDIKGLTDLEKYEASVYLESNKKAEIGKMYDRLAFLFQGKGEIKPKKDENMGKWLKRILPKAIEARRVANL